MQVLATTRACPMNAVGGGRNGPRHISTVAGDSPVPRIFLLRSRSTGDILSVRGSPHGSRKGGRYERRYSLGFVQREDADLVRSVACPKSRTNFLEPAWESVTAMFPVVAIEKRIDINEIPMFMHEMDMNMFLGMPTRYHRGVGIVHQVLDVSNREVVMEVQTLDDVEMMRMMISRDDDAWRGRGAGPFFSP